MTSINTIINTNLLKMDKPFNNKLFDIFKEISKNLYNDESRAINIGKSDNKTNDPSNVPNINIDITDNNFGPMINVKLFDNKPSTNNIKINANICAMYFNIKNTQGKITECINNININTVENKSNVDYSQIINLIKNTYGIIYDDMIHISNSTLPNIILKNKITIFENITINSGTIKIYDDQLIIFVNCNIKNVVLTQIDNTSNDCPKCSDCPDCPKSVNLVYISLMVIIFIICVALIFLLIRK